MVDPEEQITFIKALADANRLKILGLLARGPHTVEQLAAVLRLGASTVSHHLSKLAEAGLVSATARSYYNDYQFNAQRYEDKVKRLLAVESMPPAPESPAQPLTPEQVVVRNYLLPDGRLKTIPAQRKKLLAVLRHVAHAFQPGRQYAEKEVNEILKGFHEDTASLRRELVGYGIMAREGGGGRYWRVEEPPASDRAAESGEGPL